MRKLPKFPHIIVDLAGAGTNPGAMVECVADTMRVRTVDQPVIDQFRAEALAGERDHVLATILRWVRVKGRDDYPPPPPANAGDGGTTLKLVSSR